MVAELLIFALGVGFAFMLQLFVSRLALSREKQKEAWVRKLNSYENFYRAMTDVVDLLVAGVGLPDSRLWDRLFDARKSAYDAASYDPDHSARTALMQQLTLELLLLHQDGWELRDLKGLRKKVEAIRREFFVEEGFVPTRDAKGLRRAPSLFRRGGGRVWPPSRTRPAPRRG